MIEIFEIKTINKEYLPEINNLWNNNFPKEFETTERLLNNKIFEDQDLFLEASFMLLYDKRIMGIIVTKMNKSGLEEYNCCSFISALLVDREIRLNGWGTKLLAMAEEVLYKQGMKKIIVGGDFNNFFSGIPAPNNENIGFFDKRGYTINSENHFDLMADVSKIDFDKYKVPMSTSDELETTQFKPEHIHELENFFDHTFPGRWKFEVMNYISSGGDLRNILVLFDKNKIIGFCKVDISNNPDDRYLYGTNKGSLGPIGISESYRGKGVGNRILKDSLKILKNMGAQNVIIDWTILKDFYGQFGFTPHRTYRGAYKSIDPQL